MNKLNELVVSAQLLSAMMDEEEGIESFTAHTGAINRTGFILNPDFFYKTFKGFKIEFRESEKYFKFRLFKEIQGVEFVTYVDDLTGLKIGRIIRLDKTRLKRHKKSLQALQCK